ncbi:HtaA domain-containing protein [Corynebacterium sp. J010B-136]|uniref:HtaA domain-containing protein n=1 Tax=Corynebacterium sp. J010B-136 TaxID=2099401 RepID=UPI000CFA3336|nr:HtaA domain-containing protein [Corynebacterium sp. J010B-136]PQM74809.1 hypothetical protein C5Y44_03690 [Corynebacterium sp. J010B-136]
MKTTQSLRAGAVALALAASAVTVPTAIAAEAEGVPAIESGAINWPIKESFNNYINMPFVDGKIGTDQVSYVKEDKSFDFTVNPDESELDADGNGTLQLNGSIHYEGHHGALDLKYSDIKINIENGTEATITADYHLQGGFPGQEVHDAEVNDADIASFTLDEALLPVAEETYEQTDLQTSFLQGAVDSLLNYDAGPVQDGAVDLSVTFGEAPAEQPAGDDDDAKDNENPAGNDDDQDDKDKQEDPKKDPAKDLSSKDGSSKGGIIAIIVAILAAIGAAVGGFIPGINLKNFGF